MDPSLSPIALFVYNRPQLTLETLKHLAENAEAKESTLYVFCDGPKADATDDQLKRIHAVREIVQRKNWCGEVNIIASETNLGLANSIIRGVTRVVNQYGTVIVLEDDLVVSRFFLRFINDGLRLYNEDEKVLAIHGYRYPFAFPKPMTAPTFFIRDPGNLGWATWQRSWSLFESDSGKLYDLIRLKHMVKEFNLWGGYPFLQMLRWQLKGKVDSWAIRWRAVAYLHNKVTLYPCSSLVRHEGNVPEATHHYTGKDDYLYTDIHQEPIDVDRIPVVHDEDLERAFGRFLRKHAGMNWSAKISKRLAKYFTSFYSA